MPNFNKFKEKIVKMLDMDNNECYENHKNENGICYGLVGGTKSTDYLAEHCIGCKHHTFFVNKEVIE